MTNRETLQEICSQEVDGSIYENYSGRGMMGKTCIGVSCSNAIAMIEAVSAKGIMGAKWDQLGKGYIVYWPNLDPDLLTIEHDGDDDFPDDGDSELSGEADVE